jgi:signal transduction histidine kinase
VLALLTATVDFPVSTQVELEGDAVLQCVPEELNQVLTNLLENALQAVPTDGTGTLRVRGHNLGNTLVLSIKDNGPGIDAADLPRIFSAFFTSKGKSGGTGLGLTIVRRVVTSLRGTIHVESRPGAGAEFIVRVPRALGRDQKKQRSEPPRNEMTP